MPVLLSVEDPRTPIMKARRQELVRFAQSKGLSHITEDMPAAVIREELINRGLTAISIPPRQLGAIGRHVVPSPPKAAAAIPVDAANGTVTLTAEQLQTLLAQAVAQAQAAPAPDAPKRGPYKRLVERPKSYINKLRDACKAGNIHMDRRDKTADLERKLSENGQDPAQFR